MSLALPVRRNRILLVLALVSTFSFHALAGQPGTRNEEPSAQNASKQNVSNLGAEKARFADHYGKLPLSFQANAGQTGSRVKFVSKGSGYGLYLTDNGAVLALDKATPGCATVPASKAKRAAALRDQQGCVKETSVVGMRLADGANATAPEGEALLPGTANYFTGSDANAWRTGVPTYARVRYNAVYPGVDLVYYGNQRELEYDFAVAPHADASAIRLQFDGVTGLRVDGKGDLIVRAKHGDLAFRKPVVYQEQNGRRTWVAGRFTVGKRHTVGFKLGDYDHAQALVIDPVLAYSTFVGGSGSDGDEALAIAVDTNGDAYITGQTDSANFPLSAGAAQSTYEVTASASYSGFVTKLNSTGTAVVYSTYLSGSGNTQGTAIAVDSEGDAYVTGHTFSTNFPVTSGAFQTVSSANASGYTGFVSKLNPTGTALLYSTYLGGGGNGSGTGDTGYGVAVDSSGDAYVTGYTQSANFPTTTGAFQTANSGYAASAANAFVSKLNPAGSALVWSTLLGGNGQNDGGDMAYALALNSAGNVYVAGAAGSTNFPVTANAFQATNPAASYQQDAAFVTELNATGTGLVYSTYLGGSEGSSAAALAVDASGDAYVTGYAMYTDFPVTSGAFQTTNPAAALYAPCAFVTKLNSTGTGLLYSTLLGGSGASLNAYVTNGDSADGLAIDSEGDVYVTGQAWSSNFPVTSGAIQKANAGAGNVTYNAFVTEINPTGTGLVYSTYLGGSGNSFGSYGYYHGDFATGLALDSSNNIYIGGVAYSYNYPTTSGALQASNLAANNSGSNGFVSKISGMSTVQSPAVATAATATVLSANANPVTAGNSVALTATVKAVSGSSVPTGSVVFTVDGAAASMVTLNAGTATYSSASLTPGSHTIAASYSGTTAFAASASNSLPETVNTPTAAAPAFSPAVGTYTAAQTVSLSSATAGATIYYTTNGTTPSSSSTKYTGPIAVSATTSIESIAVASGYTNSVVATGNYTITPATTVAAAPTFSIAGGTYISSQSVSITCATPGVTIYYTINGVTPTTASAKYPGPIFVGATETLTAMAVLSGSKSGPVSAATYTIQPKLPTPTFSVATGTYTSVQSVTLAETTSGTTIYYTTNGTTPTTSSTVYTGPISVGASEKIEAMASLSGHTNSAPTSSTYTIVLTCGTPTFSVAAGTYSSSQSVTISNTTPGATIYYTVNGNTPTTASAKYPGPIFVGATETLRAVAIASGYKNSTAAVATYTIARPAATPTASVAAGTYTAAQTVTLSSATANATIYYTTNTTPPTTSSTVYTGPITVTASETIRAIAIATGSSTSPTMTIAYTIK